MPVSRKQALKFSVAPFVDLNLNRAGKPHDPIVALIRKRKKAVEGGIEVGFTRMGIFTSHADSLAVMISGAYDLRSVHRSFIVTPSAVYSAPLSKAALIRRFRRTVRAHPRQVHAWADQFVSCQR